MRTEQKFLYGTGVKPLSVATYIVPDTVVYIVSGHCYYENFSGVVGVFSNKEDAEKYRQKCIIDPKRVYSYFEVTAIVLDHPEKDAE